MDHPTTKAEWLAKVRQEIDEWGALLAEIGEERMTQPGATDDWTFKDVVAHLTVWRTRTVARLKAALRGDAPAPPPWPEDLDTEQINQWIYRANRDRPLDEVLHESREVFRQEEQLVEALSEADLVEPNRFPWLEGEALGPGVIGASAEHFHGEHEAAIRTWLDQVNV